MRPLRPARIGLAGEAGGNAGNPDSKGRTGSRSGGHNPPLRTAPGKRGPAQQFRCPSFATNGRRRPQMSPDIRRSGWRAGRRFRILARRCGYSNRRRQRPLARHPLASGGERERDGVLGAAKKQGGGALASTYRGCLKSESEFEATSSLPSPAGRGILLNQIATLRS